MRAQPHIRARMTEFLGASSLAEATCVYLLGEGTSPAEQTGPVPPTELGSLLERGLEIRRSLWDRASLIADLDIEYVNFDYLAEPYLFPERTFAVQQPVVSGILTLLEGYRIRPLVLLSGRGYHFLWRIARGSAAFTRLAGVGRLTPGLRDLYARPHPPGGASVEPELGAAHAGLGMLMEYVAHRIKEASAPLCELPVEVTALAVGPQVHGREMVSIDISEYGDPLSSRTIRIPFSPYLKPLQERDVLGPHAVDGLPGMCIVPFQGLGIHEGITVLRDPDRAARLESGTPLEIPEASAETELLFADYQASLLARFHDRYYAEEPEPPERWAGTYDQLEMGSLPPCARTILESPDHLLLNPSGIERVLRVLLALGWHPRHVAGLIHSRYERARGWADGWPRYDPQSRAELYTRLFAGLFATGRDDLVSFNCQSAKEALFCFHLDCQHNLSDFRESLIRRRAHG
ncbi:MAG TPA: hypothetical protein VF179_30590 [Thermoanaerobaculia bacterium]|nr:hypothetical protein [Thermoanaerobaculia bacterium]